MTFISLCDLTRINHIITRRLKLLHYKCFHPNLFHKELHYKQSTRVMCFTSHWMTLSSQSTSQRSAKGQITSYCFQFLQHVFFHKCVCAQWAALRSVQVCCIDFIFFFYNNFRSRSHVVTTYTYLRTYVNDNFIWKVPVCNDFCCCLKQNNTCSCWKISKSTFSSLNFLSIEYDTIWGKSEVYFIEKKIKFFWFQR